jgi:hypothetical protein
MSMQCSFTTWWTTSVRGDGPPERSAGQRLKPSGARGPLFERTSAGSAVLLPAKPSVNVKYQSELWARPPHSVPRRAVGIRGPLKKERTRTPPSHRECLPPRSGAFVAWSKGPPLSEDKTRRYGRPALSSAAVTLPTTVV